MPAPRARTSSRDRLFAAAEKACRELREHIAGQRTMEPADLEAAKGLVRKASKESFYFFAKVVLGFKLLTNETHKRWATELQTKWLTTDFFMRLKPRGTYKTTLYGVAFLLWVWAVFSPQIRFFYTSANETLLQEVSAELDRFIGAKAESLYSLVFGIRRDPDPRVKNTNDIFNIVGGGHTTGKGFGLMFRTAGGSTNGLHPNVIIIDDPMDKDDRESAAVRAKKERWFDSLHPLLVPFELTLTDGATVKLEKMMFIATRWHLNDLVAYVRGKSDEWDFEEEGVYLKDGSPRYPEFFGKESIEKKRKQISEIFFACQYLNDPLPEGHRIFEEKSLHFLRRDQFDVRQGTTYCFFDPSQGKTGGDFPAVIWVNLLNGRKVVFDAIDKKVGLTPLIAMIAQRNRDYRSKAIIFETNGAMTMENTLIHAHKALNYSFGYVPIHETRNKEERIAAIQPDLYNGSWFFPSDWSEAFAELRKQLIYYPAWGHDDFPDVIEKAVSWIAVNMPGSFSGGASTPASRTLASSFKNSGRW